MAPQVGGNSNCYKGNIIHSSPLKILPLKQGLQLVVTQCDQ